MPPHHVHVAVVYSRRRTSEERANGLRDIWVYMAFSPTKVANRANRLVVSGQLDRTAVRKYSHNAVVVGTFALDLAHCDITG